MDDGVTRYIRQNKWGMTEDPRGLQVTMTWRGRVLLGDVVGYEVDHCRMLTFLRVRHFCGDLWPIEPEVSFVKVLKRQTELEVAIELWRAKRADDVRAKRALKAAQVEACRRAKSLKELQARLRVVRVAAATQVRTGLQRRAAKHAVRQSVR